MGSILGCWHCFRRRNNTGSLHQAEGFQVSVFSSMRLLVVCLPYLLLLKRHGLRVSFELSQATSRSQHQNCWRSTYTHSVTSPTLASLTLQDLLAMRVSVFVCVGMSGAVSSRDLNFRGARLCDDLMFTVFVSPLFFLRVPSSFGYSFIHGQLVRLFEHVWIAIRSPTPQKADV